MLLLNSSLLIARSSLFFSLSLLIETSAVFLLPTLHHLADTRLEERETLLERVSNRKPVALVIPALYSELEHPALPRMLIELSTT